MQLTICSHKVAALRSYIIYLCNLLYRYITADIYGMGHFGTIEVPQPWVWVGLYNVQFYSFLTSRIAQRTTARKGIPWCRTKKVSNCKSGH
jgi:hypothetical protein